jgi:hypothetical protein
MGFSLFRKQPQAKGQATIPSEAFAPAPAESAPAANHAGASCFHTQCSKTEGWQCTYTDTHGTGCMSWWCRDHVEFVSGAPFCRRHARLAKLLIERVGSLYQMPVPEVADRALPLLIRLTDQLDERNVKLLRHLFKDNAQVRVADHAMMRERKDRGQHSGFESIWSASSAQGYVASISLRVSGGEPPIVQLWRDGLLIHQGVPGWIANRNEDGWHHPTDEDFVGELYAALVGTFSGGPIPAIAG